MTNQIEKTFAKRETEKSEGGEIATVTLEAPAKAFQGWTWDGKDIPEISVKNIIATYFFQSMSDAYAGEKTIADAQAMFDKKVEAMLDGTIGVRSSGGGVSELVRVMRQIARASYKAQVTKEVYKKEYTDADDAAKNALLDGIVENNRKALEKAAQAEIDKRNAEAKELAKLAGSIQIG